MPHKQPKSKTKQKQKTTLVYTDEETEAQRRKPKLANSRVRTRTLSPDFPFPQGHVTTMRLGVLYKSFPNCPSCWWDQPPPQCTVPVYVTPSWTGRPWVCSPLCSKCEGQCLAWNECTTLSFFLFLFFFFLKATLTAYGGFQARSQIRAAPAGLHHSHSNARLEPSLRPTS